MGPSQMRPLTLDGTIIPEAFPSRRKTWWRRWRRRLFIGIPSALLLLGIAGGIFWNIDARTGHSRIIHAYIVWNTRYQRWKFSEPVRPWKPSNPTHPIDVRALKTASDLYQTTNLW